MKDKRVVAEALPEPNPAKAEEEDRLAALRRMGEELRAARESGSATED